ncbi:hydroxyethylthiazole kinase [Komagataeibacter xylinus NBRC 13693]|uniref:Hydroxyethylthiazole kinase n=3 Tax=Acetobacteraceae TaxID=433 RepID=A0A0D6Q699_KOMXY|nr:MULTISPECIES: hydroxyethylthiazole kinase [Komagataeibacter]MBL7232964.1 hydroxyethylthiazole kinase [Komagataeibacter oboediens]MBT0673784.1 hydroxyethylthiazole kinase [Komagataeibacter oboediens]MBT0677493.1 hydroxyethylthiazole kinase [Komagataeibacter oboediens]MBV1823838.1 hydroxyethylthiazole kinase [Komagataeibacter oboediens]GAN98495.1 hydroxyethylthiazole kinase [Komagataeibacter xylinus NBRC 13693]
MHAAAISMNYDHPACRAVLRQVRQQAPFVYGLTNYVAATLSANVLLAAGAAPAIGAAPGWPAGFGGHAGAVWVNAAGLINCTAQDMLAAVQAANAAGVPWVLDPVAMGAGIGEYDAIIRDLMRQGPAVIRGNASEVMALAGGAATARGVETTASIAQAVPMGQDLARNKQVIVAISGPEDHILGPDGRHLVVPGGNRLLTVVTGAGCALGGLVAAGLAVTPVESDRLVAAAAIHALYARAAEIAARNAGGPASFAIGFVDALAQLQDTDISDGISSS